MEKMPKDNDRAGIMIVDDHPLVRDGLKQLLSTESDLEVCCEAGSCREALAALEISDPELAIVDLSLKDGNGIELIRDMKRLYPSLKMLVLSMHEESFFAERAIKAGAMGYIMKQECREIVLIAIRSVLSGQIFVSPDISTKLIANPTGLPPDSEDRCVTCLSNRELQVFELIGKGHKTNSIAETLSLSVKTIETYRSNIKKKLALADASQLLRKATLWVESIDTK